MSWARIIVNSREKIIIQAIQWFFKLLLMILMFCNLILLNMHKLDLIYERNWNLSKKVFLFLYIKIKIKMSNFKYDLLITEKSKHTYMICQNNNKFLMSRKMSNGMIMNFKYHIKSLLDISLEYHYSTLLSPYTHTINLGIFLPNN